MTIVRRITVMGRVQGVGYRAFVADEAARRELTGWVRNRRDGTVEALFAGSAERVDDMIDTCHLGPIGAIVSGIIIHETTAADGGTRDQGTFAVLATF